MSSETAISAIEFPESRLESSQTTFLSITIDVGSPDETLYSITLIPWSSVAKNRFLPSMYNSNGVSSWKVEQKSRDFQRDPFAGIK